MNRKLSPAAHDRRHEIDAIDAIAERIAEFHNLYVDMDAAEGLAKEAQKSAETDAERDAIGKAVRRIERISTVAYARSRALQSVLLLMEPRTLDETLSLSLVVLDHLEDPKSLNREIHRAMLAVVRGLLGSGATSPLLDILMPKADLTAWDDDSALAAADVEPFLGPAEARGR